MKNAVRSYKKKPVVIEAIQWDGKTETASTIWEWASPHIDISVRAYNMTVAISTPEGEMIASKGDYIIKGIKGEFYPCKPDIFIETYQLTDKELERESDMWPEPSRNDPDFDHTADEDMLPANHLDPEEINNAPAESKKHE